MATRWIYWLSWRCCRNGRDGCLDPGTGDWAGFKCTSLERSSAIDGNFKLSSSIPSQTSQMHRDRCHKSLCEAIPLYAFQYGKCSWCGSSDRTSSYDLYPVHLRRSVPKCKVLPLIKRLISQWSPNNHSSSWDGDMPILWKQCCVLLDEDKITWQSYLFLLILSFKCLWDCFAFCFSISSSSDC